MAGRESTPWRALSLGALLVLSVFVGGDALAGSGSPGGDWLEVLDAREREVLALEDALERQRAQARTIDGSGDLVMADERAVWRATRGMRRQVSERLALWDAADRQAARQAVWQPPADADRLSRLLQLSETGALEESIGDDVGTLKELAQGVERGAELLVWRTALDVELAGDAAKLATRKAERQLWIKRALKDGGRGLSGAFVQAAQALEEAGESMPENPSTADFHRKKGALVPPVSEAAAHLFGPRKLEGSQTLVRHTGLTYRVEAGTDVRPVSSGLVVFADRFTGYGRLVIVDHGGGYHSLYAHLGAVEVAVGQRVGRADVLGVSGESGSLEGPKLYFELRERGRAIDPSPWFVTR
ncbi:hypothetical protein DL240_09425 [Lujinxingia litoralis]|uniref:M23ase beta-sheet core domain-containing protein n=1 Tax=Lujinxingia litoralis TaxID=2211119 RepID=A0A328C748_9DELT|nr:peptidoglycan DD-metalloendopeptidase family protein [Lujinxingia litoralis]RAL23096.1 hypothetical protein DL240_09425 [Lujinxingia litoralis]